MKKLLALSILFLATNQAVAAGRVVECQIDSGNTTVYQGNCVFLPESGGSFTLQAPAHDSEQSLTDDIISVSVTLTGKGEAQVYGLTTDGINSRWGEAQRSKRDSACWVGEDFKICAW